MKRGMITFLTAICMAALAAGGCAKKEMVKSEDQSAATTRQDASKKPGSPDASGAGRADGTTAPQPPKVGDSSPGKAQAAASDFEIVYFDYDKSDLRNEAREILKKNADRMMKSDAKIRIEGHCDERGSAEYNLALGERRAKSVQQYLITLGVAADRLSIISYGKEKPAVTGQDESAWSKNRRAEFFIVK